SRVCLSAADAEGAYEGCRLPFRLFASCAFSQRAEPAKGSIRFGKGLRACIQLRCKHLPTLRYSLSKMGRPSPALLASPRERYTAGQRLRQRVARKEHATWVVANPIADRLRPLYQVNQGRLPQLLPEKYKRMRASPFAFFRGSAAIMAADLAAMPRTGVTVQLCGDAHVRNLGAYEALDGSLVFDLNDFDETI